MIVCTELVLASPSLAEQKVTNGRGHVEGAACERSLPAHEICGRQLQEWMAQEVTACLREAARNTLQMHFSASLPWWSTWNIFKGYMFALLSWQTNIKLHSRTCQLPIDTLTLPLNIFIKPAWSNNDVSCHVHLRHTLRVAESCNDWLSTFPSSAACCLAMCGEYLGDRVCAPGEILAILGTTKSINLEWYSSEIVKILQRQSNEHHLQCRHS